MRLERGSVETRRVLRGREVWLLHPRREDAEEREVPCAGNRAVVQQVLAREPPGCQVCVVRRRCHRVLFTSQHQHREVDGVQRPRRVEPDDRWR